MTAYCTLAQVMALNAQRSPYAHDTVPTRAQVEAFMDEIAAEIDTALGANGVTTPVTTPATFLTTIARLNAVGAAALAEQTGYPDSGEGSNAQRYWDQYQTGLERLYKGEGVPVSAPDSYGSRVRARSYGTDNPASDGNAPAPIFSMSDRF